MIPSNPLARLRSVRAAVRNWYWVATAAYVICVSRFPPRKGVRKLAKREVTCRLRNGRVVRCQLDEVFNVLEVFAMGAYEVVDLDWAKVETIVDIGANVGAAAIWFADRAPRARIIAVEPCAATAARLARNLRCSGLSDRVVVINSGLGSQAGTATLVTGFTTALSRTVPAGLAVPTLCTGPKDREIVTIRTLSEVLDECHVEVVDVMKIDAEGAEYAVIVDSGPCGLSRVMRIVGEYHEVPGRYPSELEKALTTAGFSASVQAFPDGTFDRTWSSKDQAFGLGLFTAERVGG